MTHSGPLQARLSPFWVSVALMSTRNLTHLLRPQSIALIGASDRPGHMGAVTWRNLTTSGFSGRLYAVNPRHAQLGDAVVYPNIAAVPEVPDLAVIVTPAKAVPGIVGELADKGVKAAVIISAGFGGSDGAALKQAMLAAGRPST